MKRILILLVFTVIGLVHRQSSPANQSALQLQPCDVQGFKEKIKCGRLGVFENRKTRKGRQRALLENAKTSNGTKISLKIVVAPPTSADRKPDPFFYIPGGPGSSATEDAPGVAMQLTNIREHRDLVFVDQRGSGGSNPLNC